jgi:hypothetical protein
MSLHERLSHFLKGRHKESAKFFASRDSIHISVFVLVGEHLVRRRSLQLCAFWWALSPLRIPAPNDYLTGTGPFVSAPQKYSLVENPFIGKNNEQKRHATMISAVDRPR